jgi:hypothetical protein
MIVLKMKPYAAAYSDCSDYQHHLIHNIRNAISASPRGLRPVRLKHKEKAHLEVQKYLHAGENHHIVGEQL